MWSSTLVLITLVTLARCATRPEDCSGVKQGGGNCVPIKTCESVIQMVRKAGKHQLNGNIEERNSIVGLLREWVCGDAKDRRICCKNLETQTQKISMTLIETVTEAVSKAEIKKEAMQKKAMQKEAMKKEAMKKEAMKKEAKKKEATKKEATKKEIMTEIEMKKKIMTDIETEIMTDNATEIMTNATEIITDNATETEVDDSLLNQAPETEIPATSTETPTLTETTTESSDDGGSGTITQIGNFVNIYHDIGGSVFALDKHTILIKEFTYDGAGPDAFLWGGNSTKPSHQTLADGFVNVVLPYPFTGKYPSYTDKDVPVLGAFYKPTDLVLKLPLDVSVEELKWISVWCRKFQVNFGHVMLTFPERF